MTDTPAAGEKIYHHGIAQEDLRAKLRDLTRDTKATHQTHDMRYPAWGLGLHGFDPIPESKNVVAEVLMTVPPGAPAPQNGDLLVMPQKKADKPALGLVFDAVPMAGDWIGDAYTVHVVQNNPAMGIGHELKEQGKGTSPGR